MKDAILAIAITVFGLVTIIGMAMCDVWVVVPACLILIFMICQALFKEGD